MCRPDRPRLRCGPQNREPGKAVDTAGKWTPSGRIARGPRRRREKIAASASSASSSSRTSHCQCLPWQNWRRTSRPEGSNHVGKSGPLWTESARCSEIDGLKDDSLSEISTRYAMLKTSARMVQSKPRVSAESIHMLGKRLTISDQETAAVDVNPRHSNEEGQNCHHYTDSNACCCQ